MKTLYFPKNSDTLTTHCPFCGEAHTVSRTDVEDLDDLKVVRFVCICDCAFHQRICKKNPEKKGLISALTRISFKGIRYKLRHPLGSFS